MYTRYRYGTVYLLPVLFENIKAGCPDIRFLKCGNHPQPPVILRPHARPLTPEQTLVLHLTQPQLSLLQLYIMRTQRLLCGCMKTEKRVGTKTPPLYYVSRVGS